MGWRAHGRNEGTSCMADLSEIRPNLDISANDTTFRQPPSKSQGALSAIREEMFGLRSKPIEMV